MKRENFLFFFNSNNGFPSSIDDIDDSSIKENMFPDLDLSSRNSVVYLSFHIKFIYFFSSLQHELFIASAILFLF